MKMETGVYVVRFDRTHKRDGTAVDFVEISNRDNLGSNGHPSTTTRHRVRDLEPSLDHVDHLSPDTVNHKMKMMGLIWSTVGPAYEAWCQGNDIPETGTPLSAWGGLLRDQAAAFASAGFRTVEEIAEAPDDRISRVRHPHARQMRKNAVEWLKGRDASDMAAEIAELRALLEKQGKASIAVPEPAEGEDLLNADEEAPEGPKRRPTRKAS